MTVENLPTRGIHWVKYLSDRLSQQNDSNILPTCRATFQLILYRELAHFFFKTSPQQKTKKKNKLTFIQHEILHISTTFIQ